MQRSGTHKVRGRGRVNIVHKQVRLARVLMRQRAVADGCRWAAAYSSSVPSEPSPLREPHYTRLTPGSTALTGWRAD
jgi:hypothetical protein